MSEVKLKPLVAWAAFMRGGQAIAWTIRMTRKDCISAATAESRGRYTWDQLRKRGWRAAKVRITEIEGGSDGKE
ncbi:hypothetical protein KPL78_19335 [Roseomonas sp. HJA6]|uniref:Uncharacterized protein n=1 Tax=Roseomonas alba TaxID=2846776 RepID=A0ABS7ACK7_9PROT|nr:hypothetical protein [Neoroseomonas alba]MBW6400023.1 hypothetical protein [Neoroseomonas alba]